VWRMEDVLELYEEPHDPKKPPGCFDELVALPHTVAEKRRPLPTKPGRPQRYDYEYEREGMVNIFAFFEPKRGWRHLDVTDRRTAVDFAEEMRRRGGWWTSTTPRPRRCGWSSTNLNTHTGAALYQAFEPEEARRTLRRLEFHYTPKHASWLNMV
jgi:hypothetical protein